MPHPADEAAERVAVRLQAYSDTKHREVQLTRLFTLLVLAIAASQPHVHIRGVYELWVVKCSVDLFTPPAQRRLTVALACPGLDFVRLWPLPPQKPWFEEGGHPRPALALSRLLYSLEAVKRSRHHDSRHPKRP